MGLCAEAEAKLTQPCVRAQTRLLVRSQAKDAARRPPLPPVSATNPVRGPVVIAPRSEAASSFLHDASAEEALFVLRLFLGQTPCVELQVRACSLSIVNVFPFRMDCVLFLTPWVQSARVPPLAHVWLRC